MASSPRRRSPAARLAERARALVAGVALAVAAVGGIAPVFAAEPTAADKETARTLMRDGDRAYRRNDYAGALKAYTAAHAIMGIPNTGIWVAKTQEALGKLVEARDTALAVTRMPKQPDEQPQATQARRDAEALARALITRIPSIVVRVEGTPGDAVVTLAIDGTRLPPEAAEAQHKVDPGSHVVSASAPGYDQATTTIAIKEADNAVATLRLTRSRQPAGAVPPVATTAPDRPSAGPPPAPPPSTALSPLVFAGFGLGAVGVGVGAVTGIVALSKASNAKALCQGTTCPSTARDPIASSNTFADVSTVAFAVGALGVGLGVVGLALSGRAHESARARVHVTAALGSGSAAVDF